MEPGQTHGKESPRTQKEIKQSTHFLESGTLKSTSSQNQTVESETRLECVGGDQAGAATPASKFLNFSGPALSKFLKTHGVYECNKTLS